MTEFEQKDVEEHKAWAAVAYLWVLFLVPLLLKPKSAFAQAHARQGLVLFIVQAVSSLFVWVPVIGQVWAILVFFIVPLYALTRALTGSFWPIPILHAYAKRISFE